ncbi:MAG: flagellar biosynthesis protein FlhB [Lachnospiraceae bacterium]|nr:flagellar biosynthesis protein FlhB [Lachnospiraceae bacterium]
MDLNDIYHSKLFIELDLQLFAKDGPNGEKTEEPTAKKKEDARKDGQVPKSTEINTAILMLAFFLYLKFAVGWMGNKIIAMFPLAYGKFNTYVSEPIETLRYHQLVFDFAKNIIIILAPVMILGVAISFLANRLQFSWKITFKPMKPKLSKINPISGLKRIFSSRTLIQFLMSVLKIVVIVYVVYDTLKDKWPLLFNFYDMGIWGAVATIGDLVIDLGIKISLYLLVISFIDLIYQRWKNHQDMMMSKQDVKDEYKNQEGDPQVKGRIKQKQREMSRMRMMKAVPQADVIITNPTHYAVAIQYNRLFQDAPHVVAKGTDYLAGKIKEIAKENNIEIYEDRALARILYNNVGLDEEIPPELYQAVAEVLAYVYRLRTTA